MNNRHFLFEDNLCYQIRSIVSPFVQSITKNVNKNVSFKIMEKIKPDKEELKTVTTITE